MNVLCVDVDSKISNLALMKVSAYHKKQGDAVTLYRHRGRKNLAVDLPTDPDKTYVSCTFTWNRPIADQFVRRANGTALYGGTGFDHGKPSVERHYLPPQIDAMAPDYDLYGYDYAVGFCNRGCNRRCQFCDVPLKEGKINPLMYRPPWTWVPDGFKKAMLLDNDIAFYSDAQLREILGWFVDAGVKASITQGWDIRLTTPERASLLHDLKPRSRKFDAIQLYFAWDYPGIEGWIRRGIPMLTEAGFAPRQLRCYILCGFNTTHEQDLHRFNVLWNEYGVYPFVMVYNNRRDDPWLRAFARYANRPAIFKRIGWEDYNRRPA